VFGLPQCQLGVGRRQPARKGQRRLAEVVQADERLVGRERVVAPVPDQPLDEKLYQRRIVALTEGEQSRRDVGRPRSRRCADDVDERVP
jgi:hypothetical protein